MMEIPLNLQSETAAKQIFLLLCHKKVALRENKIGSEYALLMQGTLNRDRLPYFSIFFHNYRRGRVRFFKETIIQVLWVRFCDERRVVFDALEKFN